jgi:hypothetical protein
MRAVARKAIVIFHRGMDAVLSEALQALHMAAVAKCCSLVFHIQGTRRFQWIVALAALVSVKGGMDRFSKKFGI